jgi:hypothetical protein
LVGGRSRVGALLAAIGRVVIVGVGGSVLGLALTALTLEHRSGVGTVEAGPWTFRPATGTTEVDPYSRAILARSGELPQGAAEGAVFRAWGDSAGASLDPGCDYRVTGNVPRARFWTLALNSAEGEVVANAADRYGFTSAEILRSADGGFEIVASRNARPGNWLPIGIATRLVLVLRLYDSELDMRSRPLDAAALPRIEKLRCR